MTFLYDVLLTVNIFNIVLIGAIWLLLVRQYLHTRFPIVLVLGFAFLLPAIGWLSSILATLTGYLPVHPNMKLIDWIAIIFSSSGFGVAFLMMILFFEYFSASNRPMRKYIVFMLLGGQFTHSIFNVLGNRPNQLIDIITYQDITIVAWSQLTSILNFTGFLFLAVFSYDSLRRSKQNAINETQLRQVKIMFYGFTTLGFLVILGIGGSVAFFRFDRVDIYIWSIFVLQRIILSIALGLIAYGYLSPGQVMYISPQRLETVLVIHRTGIPLFRYDFDEIHAKADSSLVSGAITAISAIMQEAFNTTSDLETINFQDRHLVLEFASDIAFILITPEITPFISESIKKFSVKFTSYFEEELNEGMFADTGKFDSAEHLVFESFGLGE